MRLERAGSLKELPVNVRVGWWIVVAALVMIASGVWGVAAQGQSLVAFTNAAGQLVVTSAGSGYRWVLTNPGEMLSPALGFNWAHNGDRLFFAVDQGGEVSLRAAEVSSQNVAEIGRLPNGNLSGGEWTPDNSGVLISSGDRLTWFPVSGTATDILAGQSGLAMRTPALDVRNGWRALSPDARTLIYRDAYGSAVALPLTGGAPVTLASGVDPSAGGGLWTDDGGLVSLAGGNQIVAYAPASGALAQAAGASAMPAAPLLWLPGSSTLLYQDGAGSVRAAELSCLRSGPCDPFAASLPVLPASARSLHAVNGSLVYLDGEAINSVPLSCLSSGGCSPLIAAGSAAPGTGLDVQGPALAYTAYTYNANDPADREARVLDVNCLSAGGCAPRTIAAGAQAGALSSNGQALVLVSPAGLALADLASGAQTPLSDPAAGQSTRSARWNG